MFDFAWSELGLIALVSVLVLGPKQLPETMRTMAKVMKRVRSLGAEFQGHVNDMIREAELEELREKVQKFSQTSITSEVTKLVDPTGELTNPLQTEPPPAPELPPPAPDAPPAGETPIAEAPTVETPAAAAPAEPGPAPTPQETVPKTPGPGTAS